MDITDQMNELDRVLGGYEQQIYERDQVIKDLYGVCGHLTELKKYIEDVELRIEWEWGNLRTLTELIEQKAMPSEYQTVLKAREVIEKHKDKINEIVSNVPKMGT